jgi:DNA-binding NtrC family response regulator
MLVLTLVRDAETRSKVGALLEESGHRVIEVGGYFQAELLLTNGLQPDLVLIDFSHAEDESAKFYDVLRHLPEVRAYRIVESADTKSKVNSYNSVNERLSPTPVTIMALQSLIDALGRSPVQDTPIEDHSRLLPGNTAVPLVEELGEHGFFLAASPRMLEIHHQAKLIADADVNVLILGESGTGKEVVARLIHQYSQRSSHKFLKVNCAALPADLLESELFGHQKGAFTGAFRDTAGKFEQANGGTLLLDEIGEMSAQMQAKLLHVLQDGQFSRLGGQDCIKADLRVLAATNIRVEDALQEKRLREDLYYRLSVFTINMPPLRERREEIPFFIEETIRRAPAEMKNGRVFKFSSQLIEAAQGYEWRGNLRELRNFVTRTMIMRDGDGALRELNAKIESTNGVISGRSGVIALEDERTKMGRSGMRSIMRDVKDRTEAQLIQDALDVSGLESSSRCEVFKHQLPRIALQNPAASSFSQAVGSSLVTLHRRRVFQRIVILSLFSQYLDV